MFIFSHSILIPVHLSRDGLTFCMLISYHIITKACCIVSYDFITQCHVHITAVASIYIKVYDLIKILINMLHEYVKYVILLNYFMNIGKY